jgi:hypothetical protein
LASSPKKRVRKAAKRPQKTAENDETCLQMHCVQWFQSAYPHVLMFHVANERKGPVQMHVKLKRMGVMAGVADLLVFPDDGRKIALELKDDEGDMSDDQKRFRKWWHRTGGVFYEIRTLVGFKGACAELLGPSFAELILR